MLIVFVVFAVVAYKEYADDGLMSPEDSIKSTKPLQSSNDFKFPSTLQRIQQNGVVTTSEYNSVVLQVEMLLESIYITRGREKLKYLNDMEELLELSTIQKNLEKKYDDLIKESHLYTLQFYDKLYLSIHNPYLLSFTTIYTSFMCLGINLMLKYQSTKWDNEMSSLYNSAIYQVNRIVNTFKEVEILYISYTHALAFPIEELYRKYCYYFSNFDKKTVAVITQDMPLRPINRMKRKRVEPEPVEVIDPVEQETAVRQSERIAAQAAQKAQQDEFNSLIY